MSWYELLEDVPQGVTRVLSQSGRSNATLGIDGRWRRIDGRIVPLDAHGPWLPIQRRPMRDSVTHGF
jgi:hypothetical protein